ncbi:hypothetical protein GKE82_12470 [Conexibacter sp. W3-3-2]|uniref:helix-turn-helix transcriptional regulator n=1 Tax=Conexibacter sp. W3-3-2 TaxID=2675227 RepID=UPI0012BA2266|nr:LuxR family transcriptional regulator [Conexibacter sp. W3-3-2]MTD45083.1 hypothetical protein [Conexibacter sp. W3-3-2]
MLVDDLHWCDPASLRFLVYLARRLDGLPVLLVGTLRTGETGTDPHLLAELLVAPQTETLTLAPLTPTATAGLVRARLGADADDAFCVACHDASGGNPLLLRQLLHALESDRVAPTAERVGAVLEVGPRAVSRTVLLRLARLDADALALARAVALLGDEADLGVAAELAGLDRARAAAATGPLARVEILRPELPLGFVHPLVRDAVYLELPAGERADGHARAAEILRAHGADPRQTAGQLLLSPPRAVDWVADELHAAGLDAATRGAPESAVAHLRRALAEPPAADRRGRLLFDLGRTEALSDGFAAVEHLSAALEELREPLVRVQTALALIRLLILVNRPADAQQLCRRMLAEVPADDVDVRSSLEAFERIVAFFGGPPVPTPSSFETRPGPMGATVGEKRLLAVAALERCFTGFGVQDVVPVALEALDGGVLIPADDTFLTIAAAIPLVEADRDEALAVFDEALADAHRRGSQFAVLGVHLWRGYTLLRRGDLLDAQASLERADAGNRDWGDDGVAVAYVAAMMSEVRRELGDLAGAARVLDRPHGAPPGGDAMRLHDGARIRLLLADRRSEEALEAIDRYAQMLQALTNPAWNPWRSMRAEALAQLGRTDEARALVEEELPIARAWGAPSTVGRTLRQLGELRRDEGLLREAVELLTTSTQRIEHARALLALGTLLRRERRPAEARDPLREAHELAVARGATPIVDAARAELLASGARPRATALSGVASLTASERRVADLAAAGRTNRDIAQELYVTQKTVEVHLSSTYRKLGIGSRRELVGALADG